MTKVFKISLLLLFFWTSVFFSSKLFAQTTVLEKTYSFKFFNTPLEAVVDSLRKYVNYGFAYNPDLFPQKSKLTRSFRNEKLGVILDSIFTPVNLTYKLIDNNIVILPIPQNQRATEVPKIMEELDTAEYIQLSGKLVDRKNRRPVEYASIYIQKKNIGVVSNEDGNFVLKLPKSSMEDSLYFSCIGYRLQIQKISDLQREQNVIPMEPINFTLREVKVKPVKPEEILKQAREKIPDNYSEIPLRMLAFYRETIRQDDEYVALSEAILQIYKAPYNSYLNDQVVIYKGRKNHFIKQMDTVVFKFQGGIYTSLMLDIAKNPSNFFSEEYIQYYDFELDEIIMVQGRPTYVIAFDQKELITFPLFKGELYIDVETYAIIRADFMISPRGLHEAADLLVKKTSRKLKVRPSYSSYIANYTMQHNNRWYLNYISEEVEFKVRRKFSLYSKSFRSRAEMVITQTDSVNVQRFKSNQLVRPKDIFVETLGAYDPDFWGNFNVIKPDESLQEALHKINNKMLNGQ